MWKKPSETPWFPVLYFAIRYKITGESKWKNVKEILASKKLSVYSYVFQSLDWGVNYDIKIYAGSSQGIGKPSRATISGPESKSTYCFRLERVN